MGKKEDFDPNLHSRVRFTDLNLDVRGLFFVSLLTAIDASSFFLRQLGQL
jgi:hypothetical protein